MGDLEGAAELAAVGLAVGEPGVTVGAAVGVSGWSPVWNIKGWVVTTCHGQQRFRK